MDSHNSNVLNRTTERIGARAILKARKKTRAAFFDEKSYFNSRRAPKSKSHSASFCAERTPLNEEQTKEKILAWKRSRTLWQRIWDKILHRDFCWKCDSVVRWKVEAWNPIHPDGVPIFMKYTCPKCFCNPFDALVLTEPFSDAIWRLGEEHGDDAARDAVAKLTLLAGRPCEVRIFEPSAMKGRR